MRNKVYQITINEAQYKRLKDRVQLAVTAQSDYAESKNMNTWDDPISKCLADDLYDCYEHLTDFLQETFDSAKEV